MLVMKEIEVPNYKKKKDKQCQDSNYSSYLFIFFVSLSRKIKTYLNLCLLMYFITNSRIKLTRFLRWLSLFF